ncbi:MAG: hypothetical protein GXO45_01935 [Aquificae bacterium]|nr:hypothetical protein [Aquificota bacterium]
MKKLAVATAIFSVFSFGCGVATSQQTQTTTADTQTKVVQQTQEAVQISDKCKNYVSKMEKCLSSVKEKDYRKAWSNCEGKVMWDMLKEYQDNGFCFDEDECKQKVLEEIKACSKERGYLFRKFYR